MKCGRASSLNLEASQSSETKYSVMHWQEGGGLKSGSGVGSVLTQGFS